MITPWKIIAITSVLSAAIIAGTFTAMEGYIATHSRPSIRFQDIKHMLEREDFRDLNMHPGRKLFRERINPDDRFRQNVIVMNNRERKESIVWRSR